MEDYDDGTWEEFEEWIRKTISGDFRWKIRPPDNPSNREMVAGLNKDAMKRNDGAFPEKNSFIEGVE